MKRWMHASEEYVMAMANINKKRTGLNVNIWSDGQGCLRRKPDVVPRVKIESVGGSVSVSISEDPKVLAPKNWKKKFKKSTISDIEAGIEYLKRNYDLFLQHYSDVDFSFDDADLIDSLRKRGDYN